MANTLGDKINDLLADALQDAIRLADSREDELEEEISKKEQEITDLMAQLSEALDRITQLESEKREHGQA